jgi:hypothetical protein
MLAMVSMSDVSAQQMSSSEAITSGSEAPGLGKVFHDIPKALDKSMAGEMYGVKPSEGVAINPPLLYNDPYEAGTIQRIQTVS